MGSKEELINGVRGHFPQPAFLCPQISSDAQAGNRAYSFPISDRKIKFRMLEGSFLRGPGG